VLCSWVIPLAVTLERECVEELLLKNVDAEACRVAASFNKLLHSDKLLAALLIYR